MPRHIGTCFRFYTQMRVEKNKKAFAYRIYSRFTQQCIIELLLNPFLLILCYCPIGQLNSEWIYEVIVYSNMPTKNFRDFCPGILSKYGFLKKLFPYKWTSDQLNTFFLTSFQISTDQHLSGKKVFNWSEVHLYRIPTKSICILVD